MSPEVVIAIGARAKAPGERLSSEAIELKIVHTPSTYELEPYLPHNSVLGLWAFTGYLGFTLIWLIPTVGLYVAARAYRLSTEPFDRTAALTCVCCVVVYELQCYGDMGLGSVISILLLAPSFAMIGKLAVKVGAWPGYRRSS